MMCRQGELALLGYIHYTTVKHGYVERVAAWRHSSFHRHVAEGLYTADWGIGRTKVNDLDSAGE